MVQNTFCLMWWMPQASVNHFTVPAMKRALIQPPADMFFLTAKVMSERASEWAGKRASEWMSQSISQSISQ